MSKTKKIVIGTIAALVVAGGGFGYYRAQQAKIVKVQSGKVVKMESLVQTVSASGEIKPLKYINITANSYGRIVEIPVKEGDRVKRGALLLKQESIQSSAYLRSTEAMLQQATTDAEGSALPWATTRRQPRQLDSSAGEVGKCSGGNEQCSGGVWVFANFQMLHAPGILHSERCFNPIRIFRLLLCGGHLLWARLRLRLHASNSRSLPADHVVSREIPEREQRRDCDGCDTGYGYSIEDASKDVRPALIRRAVHPYDTSHL